ncbi:4-hydroxyphenylacetate 3-hydroxylase family protein [Devosia sp. CN2-171]|uniref:4-hydroxyphenylacetate 3-hydroxylase family protein n=1 Tax=Devosia sp. CN2-171 TaxID=3400909 RepID=UPI003BF8AFE0
MLRTGAQYLKGLNDGRRVFLGREQIIDVSEHPVFRNAAQTIASIFDLKREKFTESADREGFYSDYFLSARNVDDLSKRTAAHRAIAQSTLGLLGRSPDYVASFVTGMAMTPDLFGEFSDNISTYYRTLRDADLYLAHAVVPHQAVRDPKVYGLPNQLAQTCRVVSEDSAGVVVSGMKMLATGAILADEIWIGNILPLADAQRSESITFSVPVNAPGISLWSRKPFGSASTAHFDSPLSLRFDETDCVVLLDKVQVPWNRVFVHNQPKLARDIYIATPAHVLGNHQSSVRYHEKLRFMVGLASTMTEASGIRDIPQVREVLGKLAASEAMLEGMILGQTHAAEAWAPSFVAYNRRIMYATMNWCAETYPSLVDTLRELSGSSMFQMPADSSVLEDGDLLSTFRTYWDTPRLEAPARMKLVRLTWDLVGSEFAGRQIQYEKLFAGPPFILKSHSFREARWDELHDLVAQFIDGY